MRLQVKISGKDLEEDAATVHKVWKVVGYRSRIAVDGNRGLTVAAAIHLDRLCQAIPLFSSSPATLWMRSQL
nr:hypothetical protein [Mesorhizobium amorphae]